MEIIKRDAHENLETTIKEVKEDMEKDREDMEKNMETSVAEVKEEMKKNCEDMKEEFDKIGKKFEKELLCVRKEKKTTPPPSGLRRFVHDQVS